MNMKAKFLDLSKFYNTSLDEEIHHKPGNDLKSVPHGIHAFAGTLFDVQGIIQLAGSISKERTGYDFPPEVIGIRLNHTSEKLHILHGSSWHDQAGAKIGEYRIHYADGHQESIPIVYQVNVVDWWFLPGDAMPAAAELAWKGDNERTRSQGYTIQFYKYTWANPFPELEMVAMDFISDGQESAPFLMAVTVE